MNDVHAEFHNTNNNIMTTARPDGTTQVTGAEWK